LKKYILLFILILMNVAYIIPNSSGNEYTLLTDTNTSDPPHWSNDSESIYFNYWNGNSIILREININNFKTIDIATGAFLAGINPINNSILCNQVDEANSTKLNILTKEGTFVKTLEIGTQDYFRPVWSPNGKYIYYAKIENQRLMTIEKNVIFDTEKNQVANEFKSMIIKNSPRSWGVNNELLFISSSSSLLKGEDKLPWNLYSFNLNNGTYKKITKENNILWGAWSPDGEKIISSIYLTNSKTDLAILDRNGNILKSFVHPNDRTAYQMPTWSPDGKKIAFIIAESVEGQDYPKYSLGLIELDPSLQSGPRPEKIPEIKLVTFNVYLYVGIAIGILLLAIAGFLFIRRKK
jgi:Tol biopolymer transport system component